MLGSALHLSPGLAPAALRSSDLVAPARRRAGSPVLAATALEAEAAPRWFNPLLEFGLDEPRADPKELLPLLLILPGADGSGITAWMQYPSLAQDFDLRALEIPSGDRSSHVQLVELVTREVVEASASASDEREIFLLGESMGTGVAIDVALALEAASAGPSAPTLAGLLLVSPATAWFRKFGYQVLTWRDSVLVSGRGPWPALLQLLLTLSSYELLDVAQVTGTFRRLLTGERSPLLAGEARTSYAWRVVSELPARLALDPATAAHRKGWAEPTFAAGRRVSELRVPVLCVAGTADLRVPAADEARRFEREVTTCRCVYVEGAGHAGATDDRLDLRAELAAWRREVVASQ